MRGGEKEKQEMQGQVVDEEKMEKAGDSERGGKKRKGDAPQGSRVTNENWVLKKQRHCNTMGPPHN